jgi:hypothetical protein
MVSLIQQYLKHLALVEVEPREAMLSNVAYQPQEQRVILHVLNYRQVLEKGIRMWVRAPVERVEILSPDHLTNTTSVVTQNRPMMVT